MERIEEVEDILLLVEHVDVRRYELCIDREFRVGDRVLR